MSGVQGLVHRVVDSPIGRLVLVARAHSLVAVWIHEPPRGREVGPPVGEGRCPVLDDAARQLAEYFAGRRNSFDLPMAPVGTAFQREVWEAVATIPPGCTRTYGELAAQIGRPRAAQAVGSASARNPVSIIVPCHRVVGALGVHTGYPESHARKRWLLDLERGLPRPAQ